MNEKYQQAAEKQVVHYGMGGHRNQARSIVVRHHFHARWQSAIGIDFADLGFNAINDCIGLQGAIHDHNTGDDIILRVAPGLAQTRQIPNGDGGDILHQHRYATGLRGQHNITDITFIFDQPQAAYIHRLLAHINGPAADIDVGVTDGRQGLR